MNESLDCFAYKKKKSKLDLLGEFEQSTLSKGGRPSSPLAGPEVY